MTSQLFLTPVCDVNWTFGESDEPDAAAAFAVCVSLLYLGLFYLSINGKVFPFTP